MRVIRVTKVIRCLGCPVQGVCLGFAGLES